MAGLRLPPELLPVGNPACLFALPFLFCCRRCGLGHDRRPGGRRKRLRNAAVDARQTRLKPVFSIAICPPLSDFRFGFAPPFFSYSASRVWAWDMGCRPHRYAGLCREQVSRGCSPVPGNGRTSAAGGARPCGEPGTRRREGGQARTRLWPRPSALRPPGPGTQGIVGVRRRCGPGERRRR